MRAEPFMRSFCITARQQMTSYLLPGHVELSCGQYMSMVEPNKNNRIYRQFFERNRVLYQRCDHADHNKRYGF